MSTALSRRATALLRRFPKVRVLVVGDLMLDQFIWGRVERISPEAPVPVVQVTGESFHLGGAANVANNIRALGGAVTVCGMVGRDAAGRRIVEELTRVGAGTAGVMASRTAVTIRKTRIIAHNQQVVRFDREDTDRSRGAGAPIIRFLNTRARRFHGVVVSDYGKGAVTPELLAALAALRARHGFHLVVDPKRPSFAHYKGITLATPNIHEAAEAAGIEIHDEASLRTAGLRLLERWEAEAILITRGEHGMTLVRPRAALRHYPTVARQVFDVTGAGDTVVATCALSLAAGGDWDEAAFLANHAAGVVVGKVGTATASAAELRRAVTAEEGA